MTTDKEHLGRWPVTHPWYDPDTKVETKARKIAEASDYILKLEADLVGVRMALSIKQEELEAIKAREVRLIQFIYEKFQPVRPLGIDGAEAIIAELEKGENEDTK